MRVFCVSDIHIDYEENRIWFDDLSLHDYTSDLLIVAGDVTDNLLLLDCIFGQLRRRFGEVAFVPGNHELWVHRDNGMNSMEKLGHVQRLASLNGIRTARFTIGPLCIVPLYGWYDYSFGNPHPETINAWADYSTCAWPVGLDDRKITNYFVGLNVDYLDAPHSMDIISFSHFLPRIDLMPSSLPENRRKLFPVLGTNLLKNQICRLGSRIHIYGHSHVNSDVVIEGTRYINNAFGYPYETGIAARELRCIYER